MEWLRFGCEAVPFCSCKGSMNGSISESIYCIERMKRAGVLHEETDDGDPAV